MHANVGGTLRKLAEYSVVVSAYRANYFYDDSHLQGNEMRSPFRPLTLLWCVLNACSGGSTPDSAMGDAGNGIASATSDGGSSAGSSGGSGASGSTATGGVGATAGNGAAGGTTSTGAGGNVASGTGASGGDGGIGGATSTGVGGMSSKPAQSTLQAITIHMAGDSTMSNYTTATTQEGWGQEFGQYFISKDHD
jgi:hypothetical protein